MKMNTRIKIEDIVDFLVERLESYEYPQKKFIQNIENFQLEGLLPNIKSFVPVISELSKKDLVHVLSAYSMLWIFFSSLSLLRQKKDFEYPELVLFSDVISVILYDIMLELECGNARKDAYIRGANTVHVEGLSFFTQNPEISFDHFDAQFLYPKYMNLLVRINTYEQ